MGFIRVIYLLFTRKWFEEFFVRIRIFIEGDREMKEVYFFSTYFCSLDEFHTRSCLVILGFEDEDSRFIVIRENQSLILELCIFEVVSTRLELIDFTVLLWGNKTSKVIFHNYEVIEESLGTLRSRVGKSNLPRLRSRKVWRFCFYPVSRKTNTYHSLSNRSQARSAWSFWCCPREATTWNYWYHQENTYKESHNLREWWEVELYNSKMDEHNSYPKNNEKSSYNIFENYSFIQNHDEEVISEAIE